MSSCGRLLQPSRLIVFVSGVCIATSVAAHDFWVQPDEYWIQSSSSTPVTLQVGHGPSRQRSSLPLRRITRFEAISPDGTKIDMRGSLTLGDNTRDGDLEFPKPGAYVLVLETDDSAQSHLPAIRFNDYLQAEGLTLALAQREVTHRMDVEGSENYGRRAKSIVQVGPPTAGSQAEVTKPLGLLLEIVPELSPYAVPRSATLPVHVIYEGHSLAGALVKLTNLEHDAAPQEMHLTDRAGRAIFTMPATGSWLLNVVWTKPLPRSRDTDFETVFSSLSFGFAQPQSADR